MACKHEGGKGPCDFHPSGHCKVRLYNYSRKYNRRYVKSSTSYRGHDAGKITAACELLVRADLSKRGFEVTVPVSPTAKHDLHVELPSVGWKGVQIKAAQLNVKTGRLRCGKKRFGSPILALVYLPNNTIEYCSGKEKLPKELR